MNIRKESNSYPKHLKNIWFCPQIIRNVSKFYRTCLESVLFWLKNFKKFLIYTRKRWKEYVLDPKTFEKYLISTQNIWKVFEIASRHSRSIKISCKLCRKYRICTQNIWKHRICNQLKKVSNLSSKHSKSIEFLFKLWRPNYSKSMIIVIKT